MQRSKNAESSFSGGLCNFFLAALKSLAGLIFYRSYFLLVNAPMYEEQKGYKQNLKR